MIFFFMASRLLCTVAALVLSVLTIPVDHAQDGQAGTKIVKFAMAITLVDASHIFAVMHANMVLVIFVCTRIGCVNRPSVMEQNRNSALQFGPLRHILRVFLPRHLSSNDLHSGDSRPRRWQTTLAESSAAYVPRCHSTAGNTTGVHSS